MPLRSLTLPARLLPVVALIVLLAIPRAQAPLTAQTKDSPKDDPEHAAKMAKGTELFKSHVRGLLQSKCLKCHSGEKVEGEFDMGARESLIKGGGRGAA